MDTQKLYNTPVEIAIRLLIILQYSGREYDSDQLLFLEHFSLHSNDLGSDYESLHAPVPNRGIQLYAKERVVQLALRFLLSKQLIDIKFTVNGFEYSANEISKPFLSYFCSDYFSEFAARVEYILFLFGDYSAEKLKLHFEAELLKIQQ